MVSYRDRYEELRGLLEARNQFYLDTTHELRSSINAIAGFADLLLREEAPEQLGERASRRIRMIAEATRQLGEIVEGLTELERLESGEMRYELVRFAVADVLEEIAPVAQSLLHARPGIRFSVAAAPDLPRVAGDVRRVKQVLMNFLQNAALFTEEGSIRVTATAADDDVRIEVADTGIGISEEEQTLIWDQFRRAGASISPELEGAGLGLSIAKKIVEAHRGEIGVRSRPGEGSVFWFTLPTVASGRLPSEGDYVPPAPREGGGDATARILEMYDALGPIDLPDVEYPLRRREAAEQLPVGNGETVLVVDDTATNVEVLRSILEEARYRVVTARSGDEALARLEETPADLVLTDLWMPRMSGFDLIERIRADERFAGVPVVLLTARRRKNDVVHALQVGANDTLPKPFYRGELLARVGVWLRMRALQAELLRWNAQLESMVAERTAQLEEVQGQLLVSEKMSGLGRLTAGIAHELNNPIGWVRSNVATLRDRYAARQRAIQVRDATIAYLAAPDDAARRRVADALLDALRGDARFGSDVADIEAEVTVDEASRLALFERFLAYLRDATAPGDDSAERLFASTDEGLARMTAIVADLNAFSHPSAGASGPVDLNESVRRVLAILASRIEDRDAGVATDLALDAPVRGNGPRLDQVLMNLVSNAIDACDRGGRIGIATRRDDDRAVVTVTDDGRGIPEAIRSQVFDPFFTTKPVGHGQGLGLSIVYSIVETHGGTIDLESEEGHGATFRISLPLA